MSETFHPTVAFGFSKVAGKDVLHQLFVSETGVLDWRPVPMVELTHGNKVAAIAGFIEEGTDEDE